jgi:hypothetical protein
MNQVKWSTFADPGDRQAFLRWKAIYLAQGESEEDATEKAYAHGDDGIGCTGLDCTDASIPYVALPPDIWMPKYGTKAKAMGQPVDVMINGVTKRCILGDRMPWLRDITNGCHLDLAPGAQRLFGLTAPATGYGFWAWP